MPGEFEVSEGGKGALRVCTEVCFRRFLGEKCSKIGLLDGKTGKICLKMLDKANVEW